MPYMYLAESKRAPSVVPQEGVGMALERDGSIVK